jgi:hypothetical protein
MQASFLLFQATERMLKMFKKIQNNSIRTGFQKIIIYAVQDDNQSSNYNTNSTTRGFAQRVRNSVDQDWYYSIIENVISW